MAGSRAGGIQYGAQRTEGVGGGAVVDVHAAPVGFHETRTAEQRVRRILAELHINPTSDSTIRRDIETAPYTAAPPCGRD